MQKSPEIQDLSAEREGFEPPEPFSSTVFKTAAIDHSAISPTFSKCGANIVLFLLSYNNACGFKEKNWLIVPSA